MPITGATDIHHDGCGGRSSTNAEDPMADTTSSEIEVRQITEFQFTLGRRARPVPPAFALPLILDRGGDEYILRPGDGVDVL